MNPKILGKEIKLVVFDMDGVLFDVASYNENGKKVAKSTWNTVFHELNIYHEHERLKQMFINNDFPSYVEWTDEACRVLRDNGLTKEVFTGIINRIPLMNGAQETFRWLRKKGIKTGVITGSFKALAERAQEVVGLDYIIAHCELIFNKKGNLESWNLIPCDIIGKVEYFNKLVKQLNLSPKESAFVGDEVNDIPIFRKVGLSMAFNCSKKEVKREADIVIDRKDIREIMRYLS